VRPYVYRPYVVPAEEIGILIPARMDSSRFPGKPLAQLWGKPLLWWICQIAHSCTRAGLCAVVTPDAEIAAWCSENRVGCHLDPGKYPTGSDRLAAVLGDPGANLGHLKIVVDLQCDEPELTGQDLDRLITVLAEHRNVPVVTFAGTLRSDYLLDPNCVKVLLDRRDDAIYFTRAGVVGPVFHHIGVYGYRRRILESFGRYPRGHLEKAENLEQLRLLEEGVPVRVLTIPRSLRGVNTPEDLACLNRSSVATEAT